MASRTSAGRKRGVEERGGEESLEGRRIFSCSQPGRLSQFENQILTKTSPVAAEDEKDAECRLSNARVGRFRALCPEYIGTSSV